MHKRGLKGSTRLGIPPAGLRDRFPGSLSGWRSPGSSAGARLVLIVFFLIPAMGFHAGSLAQESAGPDAVASEEPLTIEVFTSRTEVAPGEDFPILVKFTIDQGWHINSERPLQEYLIPTQVGLVDDSLFQLKKVVYPAGEKATFAFSPDEPLSVYGGTVWVEVLASPLLGAAVGAAPLGIEVTSQACNDRLCLAPSTQTLAIPMTIDPGAVGGAIRHASLFAEYGGGREPVDDEAARGAEAAGFWTMLKNFDTTVFIDRYGYILAFVAMYILGLGLTLTPCVYPIIPITIGFFGAQSGGRWTGQLLSATVFGAGIAVSYATVGTVAALSGSLMGAVLQNVWVLVALAALCFVMGLNAFGVFELRLPSWLMSLAGGRSRSGVVGAGIMGLTMGIASAPCLAAFIISLLAFVGQRGDPVLGFSMFLTLGLGLATPFVILGTFSGMVHKVPRSGEWLVFAKKVMGSLLFAAALYFLHTVIPDRVFSSIVLVSLVAAGLYFGFFERTRVTSLIFRVIRLFLAAVFLGIAFWWGMPAGETSSGPQVNWQPYSEATLRQAVEAGQPAIIDFYADWCIPCKELDKYSFSDGRVVELSRGLAMLKADITHGDSPETKKIIERFGIRGVPTIIFIGPDGSEREDLRVVQFEPAEEIRSRMERLSPQGL
jgi:thiol:disulfide interchange protein DsbD